MNELYQNVKIKKFGSDPVAKVLQNITVVLHNKETIYL